MVALHSSRTSYNILACATIFSFFFVILWSALPLAHLGISELILSIQSTLLRSAKVKITTKNERFEAHDNSVEKSVSFQIGLDSQLRSSV
jgi:hypothetical protein